MMREFLRSLWIRSRLRGTAFANRGDRLESLYRVEDPWGMDSDRERHRFAETANLLARWAGDVPNLLEIGCGEGHQTESLLKAAGAVYGLDVSERAIARARGRCPNAHFARTPIDSLAVPPDWPKRFALTTLFEVAYYASDPIELIRSASAVSDACMMTYYEGRRERLDPIVADLKILERAEIRHERTGWIAVYWRNA